MVRKLIREKNVAHIIIAALFSVFLIFGMSGVSLPLQQLQQEAYTQAGLPTQTTPSSSQMPPPTSICNSNPSTLKFGLKGAKVVELQSLLVKLGYKSLLGQSGIDGKFATSTQNAVKRFQQDHAGNQLTTYYNIIHSINNSKLVCVIYSGAKISI